MPPITIAPTNVTTSDTESPARKKTNSVSFSLDSSSEAESGVPLSTSCSESKEETEKADTRKNKVKKDDNNLYDFTMCLSSCYRC